MFINIDSHAQSAIESGLTIGAEIRLASTTDHGQMPFLLPDAEEDPTHFPFMGMTGSTWTGGVTAEYWFRGDSEWSHGPSLNAQFLTRNLTGTYVEFLPFLNPDGETVYDSIEYKSSIATTQLAVSVGYGVNYHGFALKSSIGLLQTLTAENELIMTLPESILPYIDLDPSWVPLEDGRSFKRSQSVINNVNQTQILLQASLTYTVDLGDFGLEFGPYYGHTFSSTLKHASGTNPSIDDFGGMVSLTAEL